MFLNILAIIVGMFLFVFIENFFVGMFSFQLTIILLFFLFKKVDWKVLLVIFIILFSISDVVGNLPMGSNLLMGGVTLGLLVLGSFFFSTDSDITGFSIRVFILSIYYVLLKICPEFFIDGRFGILSFKDVAFSFLKGVLSTFLLVLLEYIFASFRKRGDSSKIRLK